MSADNPLRTLLKTWPHSLEMKISNAKIFLGSHISKIDFTGNFNYSRVDVLIGEAPREISELKVSASIICGLTKELETIGTMSVLENQILTKVLLPSEIFYQSISLMKDGISPPFLHLECIGLKQQEPNFIWNPNEDQLCIKEASIVFLQQ